MELFCDYRIFWHKFCVQLKICNPNLSDVYNIYICLEASSLLSFGYIFGFEIAYRLDYPIPYIQFLKSLALQFLLFLQILVYECINLKSVALYLCPYFSQYAPFVRRHVCNLSLTPATPVRHPALALHSFPPPGADDESCAGSHRSHQESCTLTPLPEYPMSRR